MASIERKSYGHRRYLVWYTANRNKHYAIFISSLMLIVTATFQFLASSLLIVQDMPITTQSEFILVVFTHVAQALLKLSDTSYATRPLLSFNMNTTDNKYLISAFLSFACCALRDAGSDSFLCCPQLRCRRSIRLCSCYIFVRT